MPLITKLHKKIIGSGAGPVLVKAATGSAGLRIAGMGLGFLVGVQLARGLGADGYGVYGIAMSLIALLMVPTEFGLPQLVVRETAANATKGNWGKISGLLGWSVRVSVLSWLTVGLFVLVTLALSEQYIGRDLSAALLVGLALIPLVAIGKTQGAALRGLSHIIKGQVPDVLLRPGIQSVLLFAVAALAIPLTPAMAMALGVISAGIALTAAVVMLRRAFPLGVLRASPETDAKGWRSACVPMAMTEAMRILQGHLATILLGVIASASAAGIFKVATAVSIIIALPTGVLISVISPSVSSLFVSGDMARLQKLLTWSSFGMTFGAFVLSLPFLVAAPVLIELVFGGDFVGAAVPMQILCAGAILTATAGTAGTLLNMTGNERRVRRASFEALVVLAVIMPPLIFWSGASGAAVATVITSLGWRLRMVRDCRRLLGLEPGLLSLFNRRGA